MLDRSRPIPPADQPARLDALEAAVRARTQLVPEVGIVLGSGLGGLADELDDPVAIPFEEMPGWPVATAPGCSALTVTFVPCSRRASSYVNMMLASLACV